MQLQFTETQVIGAVGSIFAVIAGVVGRYIWKAMHAAESGEITLGWLTALTASTALTFGGVNWDLNHDYTRYPAINKEESAETIKAKMVAYEISREQQQVRQSEAIVPTTAAVPITFMSLPLFLLAFIKLTNGYAGYWKRQEEREESRKVQFKLDAIAAAVTGPTMAESNSMRPLSPSSLKSKCGCGCGG